MTLTVYTLKMAQRDAALEMQDDLLNLADVAAADFDGDVSAALGAMEDRKQVRADVLLGEHAERIEAHKKEGTDSIESLIAVITPLVQDIPSIVSDPMLALHDSHAYGRISITMDVSKSDDESKPFFLAPVVVKVTVATSKTPSAPTGTGTSGKGVPLTATNADGVTETRPSAAAWKEEFNGGPSMSKQSIVAALVKAGFTNIA
jgi:hypothetical protein